MFNQPKPPTPPLGPSGPKLEPPKPSQPAAGTPPPPPPPPKIPIEGPKASLAKEPEDIFAEASETVEPKAPSVAESSLSPEASLPPMLSEAGFFSRNKKMIILGLVVLVVMAAIIFGVWQFWGGQGAAEKSALPPTATGPETPTVPAPTAEATAANVNAASESAIDTDRDGISNLEENKLGTDSKKPDTDNDGLSDYEEVKVYKTDPLNPDSDGDSYLDGEEVKNGYSPLGPGKLIDLEKELDKLR